MTNLDAILLISTLAAYIVMIAFCSERLDNWIMGRYTERELTTKEKR